MKIEQYKELAKRKADELHRFIQAKPGERNDFETLMKELRLAHVSSVIDEMKFFAFMDDAKSIEHSLQEIAETMEI